ncbi:hypothetical protein ACFY0G_17515 [Streptomyces sp. NPDC001552]|uniref:hypothetical protein n=1 Tax=Streptomyces sp. NPDC001552 TaxID=3364587 RepID=UPI0036BAFB1B
MMYQHYALLDPLGPLGFAALAAAIALYSRDPELRFTGWLLAAASIYAAAVWWVTW